MQHVFLLSLNKTCQVKILERKLLQNECNYDKLLKYEY